MQQSRAKAPTKTPKAFEVKAFEALYHLPLLDSWFIFLYRSRMDEPNPFFEEIMETLETSFDAKTPMTDNAPAKGYHGRAGRRAAPDSPWPAERDRRLKSGEYGEGRATGIKRISPTHEALADWILMNPGPGLQTRAAKYFGMTPGWVSQVVNSDCFRDMLRKKTDRTFEEVVIPTRTRMLALAERTLERLEEQVEYEPRIDRLGNVAEMLLKNLGYGAPKGSGVTINNNFTAQNAVAPDVLKRAREAAAEAKRGTAEATSADSPPADGALSSPAARPALPSASEVSAGGGAKVDSTVRPISAIFDDS